MEIFQDMCHLGNGAMHYAVNQSFESLLVPGGTPSALPVTKHVLLNRQHREAGGRAD